MPRWEVKGADRTTGQETAFSVDALTKAEAIAAGNAMGFFVETVVAESIKSRTRRNVIPYAEPISVARRVRSWPRLFGAWIRRETWSTRMRRIVVLSSVAAVFVMGVVHFWPLPTLSIERTTRGLEVFQIESESIPAIDGSIEKIGRARDGRHLMKLVSRGDAVRYAHVVVMNNSPSRLLIASDSDSRADISLLSDFVENTGKSGATSWLTGALLQLSPAVPQVVTKFSDRELIAEYNSQFGFIKIGVSIK